MKSILLFFIIFLFSFSAWSMTPVSDSELADVTGQAGVNINPDLTMNINIGTMAWGDSDGISPSAYNPWDLPAGSSGGYVGINDFNITNLTIQARMESGDTYNGYNTMMLKPITIDVATVNSPFSVTTTPSWGVAGVTESLPTGTTFVRIGLGALEISMDSMLFNVDLWQRSNGYATNDLLANSAQNLGVVTMGAMSMYINPWSYVDIYSPASAKAGNTSGVVFAVNVTIDQLNFGYIGWGDKDGITSSVGSTSGAGITQVTGTDLMHDKAAGYIGLTSLSSGPIAVNGTVGVDINTTKSGIYAQLPATIKMVNR